MGRDSRGCMMWCWGGGTCADGIGGGGTSAIIIGVTSCW